MKRSFAIICLLSLVLVALNLIPFSVVGQESPEGWAEEHKLSIPEGAHMPHICANMSNIHVVWNGQTPSDQIIYKRSRDGGNNWDLEVQIPNIVGTANGKNGIAVNGDNIHIVYENHPNVMYTKSENNGEIWSLPRALGVPPVNDGYASIAVNGSNVHVVFGRYYPTTEEYQIFYLRSIDNGDTWSDIVPLSPQNNLSRFFPDIAVSGNYIHIVWFESDDAIPYTVSEVRYTRSTDNGENWEDNYALVPGGEYARIPAIAARDSDVHIIWQFMGEIYYKRSSNNGATWGGEKVLTDEPGAGLFGGDIAISGEDIHITWYDYRHDSWCPETYYQCSHDNGDTWGSDVRLTNKTTGTGGPGSYETKITAAGKSVHVVWADERDDNSVYYKRTLPNILPTSIQVSNNPTEGDPVLINATIDNNGYADAYDVNVTCYIDETIFSSQIIDLLELNVPQTVQFQWVPLTFGNYNIRIEVDPNNASYEWNETDNNLTQAVYINAIPTASLTANPTTILTGETMSFDASASSDDGTIVSYYFDFGDGNSSGWISSPTKTYSYSSSGIYTTSLIVKDNNDIESTNPAEVQIDVINRPPLVEIDYPTGGEVSGLVTITGTSSDPDGNVETVYVRIGTNTWIASGPTSWSYDWDTTAYPNGEHTISARAYDGEDYSDEDHVTVMVDNGGNIAPQVSITHPNDGDTVSGEVEIRGSASDDDGFVQIVEIQIDNEVWIEVTGTTNWHYDWDTTAYTNGEHTIKARTKDDFGLYSQEKTIAVIVDNGGNILPSVEITSHYGGEVVSGTIQIKGTAVDHDGDVKLVEVKIDDGNWITATGTTSWVYTWDTTTYSNGEHVVYARVKDDADEYSKIKFVTLIVDNGGNIPPIVKIISSTGGTVSGTVIIRGTASDLDGDNTIVSVQVKINDDWEYADGITDWSYTWDTTKLNDGNYTIHVRAYDGTDYSMIKDVEVYVDNPHKPILMITSDIPDTVSGTITIKGTAFDSDGEVTKIEIQIDDGEWKEVEGTTDWSYKLDTTKLSNGEHTIRIRVYDDEGEYNLETFNINVNNSVWTFWILLVIVIILLLISLIVVIGLKKRKTSLKSAPTQQPIAQAHTQTLRCPQCKNMFETLQSSAMIRCPYCGLSGTAK